MSEDPMILDSNIIIYSAEPEGEFLAEFIEQNAPFVSRISKVEVLGFHRITETQKQFFVAFFVAAKVLDVTETVVDEAVRLRQARKMSLGDAIIAATALVHNLTLVTRNTDDFKNIEGLRLLNPFSDEQNG